MIDPAKLALIHILKKELQLGEREYRSILGEAAGVHSARDLDEYQFHKLMDRLVEADERGMSLRQKTSIGDLVDRLCWEPKHLSLFIKKYYHKTELAALTRKEAGKLIESLKHMCESGSGNNILGMCLPCNRL